MIKKFCQKGQSMVLYALLTPLMFLAGAAAADLGWYYMNVSRLQDAADAAVIAGAKELRLDNYKSPVLVSGVSGNESDDSDVDDEVIEQINNSKIKADESAKKFLAVNGNAAESEKLELSVSGKDLFYTVSLEDNNVKHLFDIMNVTGEMKIKVDAVAKLAYQTPPPKVEDNEKETFAELAGINVVSGNWEVEDAKEKRKTWKAPTEHLDNYFVNLAINNNYSSEKTWINFNTDANMYVDGTNYRYAILDIVPANGRKKTGGLSTNYKPDSITLGFRQDITRVEAGALEVKKNGTVGVKSGETVKEIQFEEDWDIRYDEPYNRKTEIRYRNKNNNGSTSWWYPSFDLRIHNVYNFVHAYEIRADKVAENPNNPYDILWARIESEAFLPLRVLGVTDKDSHTQYKSVRQIVLNMNVDNTVRDENGKLKYRPIVMFYDGPERFDNNSTVRASKPVILNLNANFNGILYAPTSPVIFIGNGYKFNGFIVAKKYMKLKKGTTAVHYNDKIFVDENGEVLAEDVVRSSYGTYETFGIVSFDNYNYTLEDKSQDNLFTS